MRCLPKLLENKCQYCGDKYECIESYLEYKACPRCFFRYYDIHIDGTVREKDEPWLGNDLSYRNELQEVTHRGKYQNLGE